MLWINIALAAFGLVATLAAFGGKTWRAGAQTLLRRVNLRGWVSLSCLLAAFSLGIIKEIIQQRHGQARSAEQARLEELSRGQSAKISDQVLQITKLQAQISVAADNLTETTEQIGSQQLASIEAAFKLAIKTPRETDDAVVHLSGQTSAAIVSRYNVQMLLYWGDEFHFSIFADDATPSELASLELEVGGRTYPLHDGGSTGRTFERTIRIFGTSPSPMPARVLNPQQLKGVIVKIFVRTTDSSQGQSEFRRMILTSPFVEFARRTYKATTADILNMRADPNPGAHVKSRLARGSFVRVLQSQQDWAEILTPEGRQGWVASRFLGEIE